MKQVSLSTSTLEQRSLQTIRESLKRFKPRAIVTVSGGKDSSVLLHLVKRVTDNLYAIHSDTGCSFPETEQVLRDLCTGLGVELTIVKPKRDYFELIEAWGWPSPRTPWCTRELKWRPCREYIVKSGLWPSTMFQGLRREESPSRKKQRMIIFNSFYKLYSVCPLLDWKESDIWKYTIKYELPVHPVYKHFKRLGCYGCPKVTKKHFIKLKKLYPELFDGLLKFEKERIGGRREGGRISPDFGLEDV